MQKLLKSPSTSRQRGFRAIRLITTARVAVRQAVAALAAPPAPIFGGGKQ